jgi:hypothetical protein
MNESNVKKHHVICIQQLETYINNENMRSLNEYINLIIRFYSEFLKHNPLNYNNAGQQIVFNDMQTLYNYGNIHIISEICEVIVEDFATLMILYCSRFLNNSVNKDSIKYKLSYYGLITLIYKFNSLSQLLNPVTMYNIHILPHNSSLRHITQQTGACYLHSILMYFHEQQFNPIFDLIVKDIRKVFGNINGNMVNFMTENININFIYNLSILPYLWLSSVVMWREFGIGYYPTTKIFYNKFLNIFSWFGAYKDVDVSIPEIDNYKIKTQTNESSEMQQYVSKSLFVEYKNTLNMETRGVYIYLNGYTGKCLFNGPVSITISYVNNVGHAIVLDIKKQFNAAPLNGRIFDSNTGINDFECSLIYNGGLYKLFIKETPIIKENFDKPIKYIRVTNIFNNYLTYALDPQKNSNVMFSVLDCDLNNNIVTYAPAKYIKEKDTIVILKLLKFPVLERFKQVLKKCYENAVRIKIINGKQFEIIKDIPNFVASNQAITKQTIIERINYFVNNNYISDLSYLIIDYVDGIMTTQYLYMDIGLFFKFNDIYPYLIGATYDYKYYHLNQYLKFEPYNLINDTLYFPNLYYLQPIVNYKHFFKGGTTKNNQKYILITFIIIICIIVSIIVYLICNKRYTKINKSIVS